MNGFTINLERKGKDAAPEGGVEMMAACPMGDRAANLQKKMHFEYTTPPVDTHASTLCYSERSRVRNSVAVLRLTHCGVIIDSPVVMYN